MYKLLSHQVFIFHVLRSVLLKITDVYVNHLLTYCTLFLYYYVVRFSFESDFLSYFCLAIITYL